MPEDLSRYSNSLDGTNVNKLVDEIYKNGFIRHNRFEVDMGYNNGDLTAVPTFSVRLPGWDIATVTETGAVSSIKTFPFRKNWNQSLFITFYMQFGQDSVFDFINSWNNSVILPEGPTPYYNDTVKPCYLKVKVGENARSLTWNFKEIYPRVLYPIELKPVEDFSPFLFSVQFVYRYFDIEDENGNLLG